MNQYGILISVQLLHLKVYSLNIATCNDLVNGVLATDQCGI